jgi:hypothetical protein
LLADELGAQIIGECCRTVGGTDGVVGDAAQIGNRLLDRLDLGLLPSFGRRPLLAVARPLGQQVRALGLGPLLEHGLGEIRPQDPGRRLPVAPGGDRRQMIPAIEQPLTGRAGEQFGAGKPRVAIEPAAKGFLIKAVVNVVGTGLLDGKTATDVESAGNLAPCGLV